MGQFSKVLLAIDKAHTVPQKALYEYKCNTCVTDTCVIHTVLHM